MRRIQLENNNEKMYIKILVFITFISMVTINALANILPINGMNTGQISDSYPNLFAPAGYTFSIWGIIYLLLGIYTIYQLGLFRNKSLMGRDRLINKVGMYFSISSIANIFWILAWHYQYIGLSLVLMVIILGLMILINGAIKGVNLTSREKLFIKLPFSVYYGWITIATIANVTTYLVSINWNGFDISETIWTMIILVVGVLIGSLTIFKNRDIPYGLVLVWAYMGILIKHVSDSGFAGEYVPIIITLVVSIVVIIAAIIYSLSKPKRRI